MLLVAEVLLFRRVEFVTRWFYSLAWWSYILMVDAVVYRLRRESLIVSHRREFWTMLPLSVCIWLVFELFNVRLHNWHYVNLTAVQWERWFGYGIAFATVLPGIFETTDLLEATIFRHSDPGDLMEEEANPQENRFLAATMGIGAILLLLSLAAPLYFFPAVWLGFIFLLDPINYRWSPQHSLLFDLRRRRYTKIWALLCSGIICGLLWEFWNYWSLSKWVYTVPIFGNGKVFEMPVLGFLGFPPFALECYAMYNFLRLLQKRQFTQAPLHWAFAAAVMVFMLAVFIAIDYNTVFSYTQ